MEEKRSRKTKKLPLDVGDSILGLDPGTRDLGVCRVTVKNKTDKKTCFELKELELVDLGTNKPCDAIANLVSVLRKHPEWTTCRYVVIEQQPPPGSHAGSAMAVAISYALQASFLSLSQIPTVLFASSAAKFQVFVKAGLQLLHPPKKEPSTLEALTAYQKRKQRKENAVELTAQLLSQCGNDLAVKALMSRKKSERDDLSDAFVYAVGFIYKNL